MVNHWPMYFFTYCPGAARQGWGQTRVFWRFFFQTNAVSLTTRLLRLHSYVVWSLSAAMFRTSGLALMTKIKSYYIQKAFELGTGNLWEELARVGILEAWMQVHKDCIVLLKWLRSVKVTQPMPTSANCWVLEPTHKIEHHFQTSWTITKKTHSGRFQPILGTERKTGISSFSNLVNFAKRPSWRNSLVATGS